MRKLDRFFLKELKKQFDFLKEWQPYKLNAADRPVTFGVKRKIDQHVIFFLEFGRLNNSIDESYTNGITRVWLSDSKKIKEMEMSEGESRLQDILEEDTKFILTEEIFRSQLVNNEKGFINYTLYKNTPLEKIKREAKEAVEYMKKYLD